MSWKLDVHLLDYIKKLQASPRQMVLFCAVEAVPQVWKYFDVYWIDGHFGPFFWQSKVVIEDIEVRSGTQNCQWDLFDRFKWVLQNLLSLESDEGRDKESDLNYQSNKSESSPSWRLEFSNVLLDKKEKVFCLLRILLNSESLGISTGFVYRIYCGPEIAGVRDGGYSSLSIQLAICSGLR